MKNIFSQNITPTACKILRYLINESNAINNNYIAIKSLRDFNKQIKIAPTLVSMTIDKLENFKVIKVIRKSNKNHVIIGIELNPNCKNIWQESENLVEEFNRLNNNYQILNNNYQNFFRR